MDIEFIGGNKVAVSMTHHIDEVLEDFGETLKGNMMNPKNSQLFTVISETKELDDEKKERCPLITVKILSIMTPTF